MRPRLSGDLRRANRVEVMRSFYGGRTQTRADVAGQLGVSVATVGTIIAELTAAGLLAESQSAKSAGGRPASRLRGAFDKSILCRALRDSGLGPAVY